MYINQILRSLHPGQRTPGRSVGQGERRCSAELRSSALSPLACAGRSNLISGTVIRSLYKPIAYKQIYLIQEHNDL